MIKYSTNIKDYPTYEKNPTLLQGIGVKRRIPKTREVGIDIDTGERIIIERAEAMRAFYADEAKLLSLPNDHLVKLLPVISRSGLAVLSYVLKYLHEDADSILMYPNAIADYLSHKNSTIVYRGISDLLSHEVIFRKKNSSVEYYINSNMYFHGDRAKIINNGRI